MLKQEWAKDQWAMSSSDELSWIIHCWPTLPMNEREEGEMRVNAKKGMIMLFVLGVTQARTHFRIRGIARGNQSSNVFESILFDEEHNFKKGLWESKDYYFNVYFILRMKYYLVSRPWILSSMSFDHQVFPHSWTTLSFSYHLFSLSISSPPLLIYRITKVVSP